MKNILVATDFPSNAQLAAICAAELSCRLGARLILFHALPPVDKSEAGESDTNKILMEKEAQKKLDVLALELHKRFGISVSRLLKPGHVKEEIPAVAKNLRAELVIMGARGEGYQSEQKLGSLASYFLKNEGFPIVCVPEEAVLDYGKQLSLILNSELSFCNSIGLVLLTRLYNTIISNNFIKKTL